MSCSLQTAHSHSVNSWVNSGKEMWENVGFFVVILVQNFWVSSTQNKYETGGLLPTAWCAGSLSISPPGWQNLPPHVRALSFSQAQNGQGGCAVTSVWPCVRQPRPSPHWPAAATQPSISRTALVLSPKLLLSQRSRFSLQRVGEIPPPHVEAN